MKILKTPHKSTIETFKTMLIVFLITAATFFILGVKWQKQEVEIMHSQLTLKTQSQPTE